MSEYLFTFRRIGSELRLRFPPVMITRLMLSLKKAATSHEHGWSFGEPTTRVTLRFVDHRGGVAASDEINLDTFESTRVGSQGQE
jgi:hypothetical protein